MGQGWEGSVSESGIPRLRPEYHFLPLGGSFSFPSNGGPPSSSTCHEHPQSPLSLGSVAAQASIRLDQARLREGSARGGAVKRATPEPQAEGLRVCEPFVGRLWNDQRHL